MNQSTPPALKQDFPPLPEAQATLANWRTAPFNRWGFQHVRELVPSADIANDPERVSPLPTAYEDLSPLEIEPGMDLARFLEATGTDALVVLRRGRIVFEHYANGMTAHTPHILMSVSKSLLGLLAGILAARSVLDAERPVTDYVPELARTAYAGASVRQLLDMRASIVFDEDYLATEGPIIAYRKATNWNPLGPGETPSDLHSFFATLTDADGAHGGRFHYVSPNTDLLGWVIERAAGARYADLMSELLWRPMGAERSAYVTVDRLGAPRVAGGMCTTARDLARVGQLLVEGGRGVVPAEWIEDIATRGDPAAWAAGDFTIYYPGLDMHYRSKWYVVRERTPLLFAMGIHGQNLFVDRARRIVLAKFSSQALPIDEARIALATRGVERLRAALAA
jgi:CubicO group peptidase (beta-lactamase class C family)